MASRKHDIYLRVLKNISPDERSERVKYFSAREDECRISKRPCNFLFII